MAQVYNPFLPINEYIPDGEPHVFEGRIYFFGSHDEEAGMTYCCKPYRFWSAPVGDLTSWSNSGDNYSGKQDVLADEKRHYTYAPDVVRGNDGRYYLYYCLAGERGVSGYSGPISVAVSDTPDGKYEYLGYVKNPDGTPHTQFVTFDPAVINDDGVIRLYYGAMYPFDDIKGGIQQAIMRKIQVKMFEKSVEEIKQPGGVMGPIHVTLADDMLTVNSSPVRISPTKTKETQWEKHPFFEGASIRKIAGSYYFIYSSWLNHELCYATSKYPNKDFSFGGTIISNGDIGFNGRKKEDRLNTTGTTHGSIEKIGDKWYVFYHRLTHGTDYSRQACAEEIRIKEDGSIDQVEMTSCGLNGRPLDGKGIYPAVICCNLTNGKMPHISNKRAKKTIPCVSSNSGEQFITNVSNKTVIGYNYFDVRDTSEIALSIRGDALGVLEISSDMEGNPLSSIHVSPSLEWKTERTKISFGKDTSAIFIRFTGKGSLDIKELILD